MDPTGRVVVVGASAAGLSVVQELRRLGYPGELLLIGDEEHLPYDRPPLSKQVLTGAWEADRVALTTVEKIADLTVQARLGCRALALDADTRTVLLADGSSVDGSAVVIATGCSPRQLSGSAELVGVHTLRTLADSQQLRGELGAGRRVVVIGAGFLGMEIAAVAGGAGGIVTVVSEVAPMIRAVGTAVSGAIAELHREQGVQLLVGGAVDRLQERDGRAAGARLVDGTELAADVVVVAIGAVPATDWLAGSGLTIDDGVVCDEGLRAGPGVFAVGDVARWPDSRSGRLVRVEHRMHATESGAVAAANIMGHDLELAPIPFWWSDQYAARIQAYGWPSPVAHLWQGNLADRKAVVLYSKGDLLTGALGWNSVKQLRAARELLVRGVPLADVGPILPLP